jgi:2'-phosphotransferase
MADNTHDKNIQYDKTAIDEQSVITTSQRTIDSNHHAISTVNHHHHHHHHHRRRHRRHRRDGLDDESNRVKTSKTLSWLLRHAALELGMTIGADGYVPVSQILSHPHKKLRGIVTWESIQQAVAENDKQRFTMIQKSQSVSTIPSQVSSTTCENRMVDSQNDQYGDWYIRANQGHSITTIDPYQLLTLVDPRNFSIIVHGTFLDCWKEGIQSIGLSKMGRTHIHFAKGMPNDQGVISGMKSSCQVFIFVNAKKCAEDQIEFFESSNGVILTPGLNGILPTRYFSHVLTKSGSLLLDNR